jgi:hypothetical protein
MGGGADGLTFIDRDRQLFKFVLPFLRDRDLDVKFLDDSRPQAAATAQELEERRKSIGLVINRTLLVGNSLRM